MPAYPQLPLGVYVQIPQNAIYALPGVCCYLSTSVALEGAFDSGGPWVAVPGNPGPSTSAVSCNFVRCTTAAANVICKKV